MSRLAWGLAIGLLVGNSAWAIDILSCGETVPASDVGVLQADLTCSGVGVYQRALGRPAALRASRCSRRGRASPER